MNLPTTHGQSEGSLLRPFMSERQWKNSLPDTRSRGGEGCGERERERERLETGEGEIKKREGGRERGKGKGGCCSKGGERSFPGSLSCWFWIDLDVEGRGLNREDS